MHGLWEDSTGKHQDKRSRNVPEETEDMVIGERPYRSPTKTTHGGFTGETKERKTENNKRKMDAMMMMINTKMNHIRQD